MTQTDMFSEAVEVMNAALSSKPKKPRLTQLDIVREAMGHGGWWSSIELRQYALDQHGRMFSDSSITARMRDVKNVLKLRVEKRRRKGKPYTEYRLK